jgi:purine-binding chemotaxis protein CheW
LYAVDRVVRMVASIPLPRAPEIILGVVNVQGKIIPVINMRRRLGLPERKVALSDQMVIAHTARRPVALCADSVLDAITYSEEGMIEAENILPGVAYIEGVIKMKDGLIFIHDLDKFLSLEEEGFLADALENRALETP